MKIIMEDDNKKKMEEQEEKKEERKQEEEDVLKEILKSKELREFLGASAEVNKVNVIAGKVILLVVIFVFGLPAIGELMKALISGEFGVAIGVMLFLAFIGLVVYGISKSLQAQEKLIKVLEKAKGGERGNKGEKE